MGDEASVFRTAVRIPTASGDDLEAWVYQPDGHGPHPAVVMAHGFAGVKAGGLEPFAERFCREGFTAVAFDYRHWGGSSGKPREVTSILRQRERFIRTGVPEGKPHSSFRDGSGLCLRLLPSGAASWQFIYRPRGVGRSGAQRTATLGSWPAIDVRRATEEGKRLAGEVAARRDPRADINEAKRRERAIVAAALDAYEKWTVAGRLRKVDTMMSSLRRGLGHLLPRCARRSARFHAKAEVPRARTEAREPFDLFAPSSGGAGEKAIVSRSFHASGWFEAANSHLVADG
jgi:hypothetical protein